jgi:hypothetical protein
MKSRLTKRKPTFPSVTSKLLQPKIASQEFYKEYFSHEPVKIRMAQCELEFEFAKAFKPFVETRQADSIRMVKVFEDFFPGWPNQKWDEVEPAKRHEFLLYCYPPPIGIRGDEQKPQDPKRPRRAIREEIWIDLSYNDAELRDAFDSLLKQIRNDPKALPSRPPARGRGATLAQIQDKLTALNAVCENLAGPRFRMEAKPLLKAYRNTLAELRNCWRSWRVGHFYTREITYGYGNSVMSPPKNQALLEEIDNDLLAETDKLSLKAAKKKAGKYLQPTQNSPQPGF